MALKQIIAEANYAYLKLIQMKYYLTTPLYYVNAAPHIGHTYTTMAAETIARFKRMQGYDAVLFTGTDEHGQKVERSAEAAGKIAAGVHRRHRRRVPNAVGEARTSASTASIRTTDPQHHKVVQDLFQRCLDNGYVYKGSYTGQYCVFDELYVNDAKPGDPCPDCGRPTETVTEENYFFKLSAFTDKLLELYEDASRVHPARDAPQRSARLRQAGPERSLHQPHDDQVGHPAAGRRQARLLRLVRRADRLHERGGWRRICGPPTCT